ncbi:polysaccharide pyruvyl transferase family protein [Bifidobacterium samirii]|uniref:Polysaccharide pyruvyl transferase n=1 Tax=Bifidobacterium samirii TaxID=2306974 RepID=A0A430FUD0_9BIFI|nr:polysaccharide pyruvyl transferase family protein [Bifidobacterium samirii]RSX56685.1 polysaccharide pyruvyl transferase [Bifidobacterium samirii]
MSRIALITYHRAHNSGSFLQAYAMQRVIGRLGHRCDVIDFSTPRQQYLYALYKPVHAPKDLVKNVYTWCNRATFRPRHDEFERLIAAELRLTRDRYEDPSALAGLDADYDAFVSGGDQIWNMDAWDYSDAYFLDFVHGRPKIAYAASMGGHISDKQADPALAERYRTLTAGYRAIGVREDDAREYLAPLADVPVERVLDPTMLLDVADYERLRAPRIPDGPYLFYYAIDSIGAAPAQALAVRRYARRVGLPVYAMVTGNRSLWLKRLGFRLVPRSGPREFLSLISRAERVVTSSFHGTVFSIMYGRPFRVPCPLRADGSPDVDGRMGTLLDVCGLEGRLMPVRSDGRHAEAWDADMPDMSIDYAPAYERLELERARSLRFLRDALDGGMG